DRGKIGAVLRKLRRTEVSVVDEKAQHGPDERSVRPGLRIADLKPSATTIRVLYYCIERLWRAVEICGQIHRRIPQPFANHRNGGVHLRHDQAARCEAYPV